MNIDQLQCFLTVADTLNFARAAEQLHVTQPAVTQQIHALERELGVPLFRRTTRTVRITEEGLAFLDDAREIVARAERARLRFHSADSEIIHTLSIASQSAVVLGRIVPALEALAHRWPDLHPGCRSCPTSISSACWKKATWTPPWPFAPNICASPAPSTGNCAVRGWSAPCAGITRWPDRNA